MMSAEDALSQSFEIIGRDFSRAGSVSTKVKEILQEIGIEPGIIRRAAIAAYEAEMNVVMYANRGEFVLTITPKKIHFKIEDKGPGIEDIDMAMQEGYSTATDEMREMGFGAGMGLPNIKRNADKFEISSTLGSGTTLDIILYLNQAEKR
jgi:anti-sigma regulatory factor (Ser/Thr protein kinase)